MLLCKNDMEKIKKIENFMEFKFEDLEPIWYEKEEENDKLFYKYENKIYSFLIDEKNEVKLISKIIKNSSTFLPSQNIYSNGKVFSFLEEKLMLIIGNKKNKYLYTLFDFANLKFSEEMEIKIDSPLMLTNEEKIILEFFKKSMKFEDLLNAYN